MAEQDEKAVWCPSCGTHIKGKAGEKIVCTTCGGSFTFTPAGEAKLADVGEFDQLKEKVGALEAGQQELRQALGQPPAEAKEKGPADLEAEPEEEDEDL